MTLRKGWLNRQFASVAKEVDQWPDWMQREVRRGATTVRVSTPSQDQKQSTDQVTAASVPHKSVP